MSGRQTRLWRNPTRAAAVVLAAALWGSVAPAADALDDEAEFGTGFVPVTPQSYSAFPKVQRFRSFFGESKDLTSRFPTPGVQGAEGACTAWAVGYAARSFLASARTSRRPDSPSDIISPAYIYNSLTTDPQCHRGAMMQQSLDLLTREGAATLTEFPYTAGQCQTPPPDSLRAVAARFRIAGWRAVEHKPSEGSPLKDDWRNPLVIDDIKGELWLGHPVVFGMSMPHGFQGLRKFTGVYHSDERFDRWNPTGAERMHALALVGYDDRRQAFRLINSWGTDWGDGGYLWIDYQTFQNVVGEAYVLEPLGEDDDEVAGLSPVPAPTPPDATVQQRLRAALGGGQCAQFDVSAGPSGSLVSGFAGSAGEIAARKARAVAIEPGLHWSVAYRPWPQCEAELTLLTAQTAPGAALRIGREQGPPPAGDPVRLAKDDIFTIEAETTAARPYLHVIYLQADGSAVELYRGTPSAGADGRRLVRLGADGRRGVRFQIAPPYGDEVILAIASERPMFGTDLSDYATEREFLSALRTALARGKAAGLSASAAMVRVRTSDAGA